MDAYTMLANLFPPPFEFDTDEAMEWYDSLSIDNKISLKGICDVIVGTEFCPLVSFLGFKTVIKVLYDKLIVEGIIKTFTNKDSE